ncbi:hypothetical protein BCF44_13516 [Kutzneria buriramensis]|uniref:Uncharacterized protein n=2 Tax=Kutzneria buriramensis TaxID=1045776 RepID=A0A3E0GSJ8_9PSEU|nr:hypothetical protein BCF44_13516 [Kutzneria buriramensis]
MAATATMTAEDFEKGARDFFVRHCGDIPRYEKYGTMIVASVELVKAVVQLLTDAGVEVQLADPVRSVPGEDHLQYGALAGNHAGRPVVVPLVPGFPEVRVFAAAEGTAVGEVVTVVTVPADRVERGGWVPAAAIAEQLRTILSTAA